MGQPVKLSDALVMEARIAGAAMERSIAGQVEFWARLGKSLDRLLNGEELMALRSTGTAKSLSECIGTVNEPEGRQRLRDYLESKPFPRFMADPDDLRGYIREDSDGTRTRGRIVGREFVPLHTAAGRKTA